MKLARPDLFHPKVVLAGCPKLIQGDGDDSGLVAALAKRGLNARCPGTTRTRWTATWSSCAQPGTTPNASTSSWRGPSGFRIC